jgi:hypothetical protein
LSLLVPTHAISSCPIRDVPSETDP